MRAPMRSILFAGAVIGALATAARADDAAELTAALRGLHDAAGCATSGPLHVWCPAADGWAGAKTPALPRAKVLVGITVELAEDGDASRAVLDTVTLSALAFRSDGKQTLIKLTMIKPTSDDEVRSLTQAVASIALVLKGKAAAAELPKDLTGYLAGLPADASYPVTKGARGWTWTGASRGELRRVGDVWVVVETAASGDGYFVSVFVDKIK
jgi:hypothetical protein